MTYVSLPLPPPPSGVERMRNNRIHHHHRIGWIGQSRVPWENTPPPGKNSRVEFPRRFVHSASSSLVPCRRKSETERRERIQRLRVGLCFMVVGLLVAAAAPSYSCLSGSKDEIVVGRGAAMSCLVIYSSLVIHHRHHHHHPQSPPCSSSNLSPQLSFPNINPSLPPAVPHHPLISPQPSPHPKAPTPPLRKEKKAKARLARFLHYFREDIAKDKTSVAAGVE